ncbi:MAG: TRAP transporter substrate-binding protein DctP [Opitutae bacterium]|nr:TRAP transporter substrate-binding protein DctP [Opitutae bacterium]
MKSLRSLRLLAALLAAVALVTAASAATRFKLGTLVPAGSSYYKSLQTMGEAWRKESAGAVDLNLFAGGKLGGEAEMVGLMKVNSLQAAFLTAVGLSEIEPAVAGRQYIPMGFRNLDEVDYVGEKLRPTLEARMAAKGFVVLFWTDAGWVRFFTNQPVTHPDDMRKLKLFTWSGSSEQVGVYKSAGFNAVPLETADIVPSLQTKLIDAVPVPPYYAMVSQIDARAPFMLELNWSPLVGALVVRKEIWDKLPEATRTAMMKAADIAGREIKAAARREMDQSVSAMEKRGLKVTRITPEIEAEWRALAEAVYPRIRGPIVPADIFDETMKILAEYRANARK